MELSFRLRRFRLERGSNLVSRSVGQHLAHRATRAPGLFKVREMAKKAFSYPFDLPYVKRDGRGDERGGAELVGWEQILPDQVYPSL